MSTPNPLAPQGSLLEKQGRGRSTVQIISFIGALHLFVLCALLWIGCKQDKPTVGAGDPALPGHEAGLPPVAEPPPVDAGSSNVVVAPPPTNPPLALPPVTGPGAATSAPPIMPPPPNVGVGLPGGPGAEVAGAQGSGATEHKVASGDTGASIAKKHGVTVAALKAANANVNWNKLKIGQVVAIPAATAKAPEPVQGGAPEARAKEAGAGGAPTSADGLTHTVRAGETGSKIAKKYGVAWRKIRDLNGLTSDSLKVGQKLNIPSKGSPGPEPAAPATPAAPSIPVPPPGGGASPVVTPLPIKPGR